VVSKIEQFFSKKLAKLVEFTLGKQNLPKTSQLFGTNRICWKTTLVTSYNTLNDFYFFQLVNLVLWSRRLETGNQGWESNPHIKSALNAGSFISFLIPAQLPNQSPYTFAPMNYAHFGNVMDTLVFLASITHPKFT
jgi:hypothetical protein